MYLFRSRERCCDDDASKRRITVDGAFKATVHGVVRLPRSHTISFGTVSGYTTPANQTVTVNNGQTTTVTGHMYLFRSRERCCDDDAGKRRDNR